MAYERTAVPVEKSQGEIRRMLAAHEATRFGFGEDTDSAGVRWAAVTFEHRGLTVRMRVPHNPVDRRVLVRRQQNARTKTSNDIERELVENEARRIWRVMAHNLKARLVAVQEGVETFEQAFLAHLLDTQTGLTIYEQLTDTGRVELDRPLQAQLPAGGTT